MINKKQLPEYSLLFGFKILNSSQSILAACFFIFCEVFVTPFFGLDRNEQVAGLFFILLINISIIILIVNAFIRIPNIGTRSILLFFPFLIYIPFSINRIFIVFPKLVFLFN